LSDVPDDIYSESDGASDIEGKIKNVPRGSVCDSDSEIGSDKSTSYAGATSWGVNDKMPNLGHFTGNSGVKEIPSDPSDVSEVTELFFRHLFSQILCEKNNLYYLQKHEKCCRCYKVLNWVDVTVAEMKKFVAIIILMGQARKDNLKEYWATDPFLEILIFGKLMTHTRFEQSWWCLHFNNNELQAQSTNRLFKIQPILEFFLEKF
jgi:hypothetical protein